jgi:predicted Co/Zn/Cd cation transporter (cation efflux family)
MNINTMLVIIIIILFSSKLWDIGKGLLYILILLQVLKYINIPLGNSIKNLTNNIINYNPKKIKQDVSSISKNISNENETTTSNKKFDVSFDDGINDNRNFLGRANTNRNLSR